jgi:hypothetical protein
MYEDILLHLLDVSRLTHHGHLELILHHFLKARHNSVRRVTKDDITHVYLNK